MLKNRHRPDARARPVVITLRVTADEKARLDEAAIREKKSLNRHCVEVLLRDADLEKRIISLGPRTFEEEWER